MQDVCLAHPDFGDVCWKIAGTKRNIKLDKSSEQQARELKEKISGGVAKRRCKFVGKYLMCQCCPYYKYAERMKSAGPGQGKVIR